MRIRRAVPMEATAADGVQVAQAGGAAGATLSDASVDPGAAQDAPRPILPPEERPPIPGGVDAVDPTTRSKPHPEGEWRPDESDPSGWRWTLIDPKTGEPVTANNGQPLTAHALELPPDALKPEDRAEARRLAEAWRVSRHIENAEHPAVLSVMRKMTRVQEMTPEEVDGLKAEIKRLEGLGPEGGRTAHWLQQKVEAAHAKRPFDFPQALTAEQLAGHAEASESVEGAVETVDGASDVAAKWLIKAAPRDLKWLAAAFADYLQRLEDAAAGHYGGRSQRLRAEQDRRRRDAAP